MTLQTTPSPKQFKALLGVMEKRLRGAESTLKHELAALHKVEQELEQRRTAVKSVDNEIDEVIAFLGSDSLHKVHTNEASDVDTYKRGLERRYWLDYNREREQYYLELTQDELKEHTKKVAAARVAYKAIKIKSDVMSSTFTASMKAHKAKRQARLDAEKMDAIQTFRRTEATTL